MKRTIAELAERRAELEAELVKLRQEIAARAGEVDEPEVQTADSKPAVKTTAKK
jgi:ribosomal protein L29